MEPSANAMAHVRAKPVMREMMVQMLMSAAEVPMAAVEPCSLACAGCLAAAWGALGWHAASGAAEVAERVWEARASLSDMKMRFLVLV